MNHAQESLPALLALVTPLSRHNKNTKQLYAARFPFDVIKAITNPSPHKDMLLRQNGF
jgi:hypothetical protein